MYSLPGTPVLRYGDEIGMGDNLALPERNCARTPMQWSSESQGGFTRGEQPVLPVISDGPYGYDHVNVAFQRRDSESMLNWTERMIRMRKEAPEIGWGEVTVIDCGDPGVLILRYEWRKNVVAIIHSFHDKPVEIGFRIEDSEDASALIDILDGHDSHVDGNGEHRMVLEPYGFRWYRSGGLDYLLKRSEV
jgi:maltose alpha-D-glucosyltransferase/alpha-amylase